MPKLKEKAKSQTALNQDSEFKKLSAEIKVLELAMKNKIE